MSGRRRRNKQTGRPGAAGFLLVLVFLLLVGALLISRVFVVRNVRVAGGETRSAEEIVAQSGIEMGGSVFAVNKERIAARFASDGLIAFESFEISWPDTVTLTVRERSAASVASLLGVYLKLDENCYVMERGANLSGDGLPVVTGVSASVSEVGRQLISPVYGQVDAISRVTRAIRDSGLSAYVSELNVSDLDNLYLVLRNGMLVKIGEGRDMDERLKWMLKVLEELKAEGKSGGVLDVSGENSAIYSP